MFKCKPTDGGNINIWDEPTNSDTLHEEPNSHHIVSGTLNKLIEKLTEEHGEGTTACIYS